MPKITIPANGFDRSMWRRIIRAGMDGEEARGVKYVDGALDGVLDLLKLWWSKQTGKRGREEAIDIVEAGLMARQQRDA